MDRPLVHRVYDVVLPPFRRRRMRKLDRLIFDECVVESVIDLGGTETIWAHCAHRPEITVVNLSPGAIEVTRSNVQAILGDATATGFEDNSFDLVFSNSVIEHVGKDRWQAFADEVDRLGPASFIQTPSRWFPFEPHLLGFFIHYLPVAAQRRLIRWFTGWGWLSRPSQDRVDEFLATTDLLTARDLRRLFPNHTLLVERFLGLPKSFIVYRCPQPAPGSSRNG